MTTTARGRYEIDGRVKGAREVSDLARGIDGLEKHLGSVGRQFLKADLASSALQKGLATLQTSLKSVVETGLTWNDWIGDNADALDGMQRASAGIIGKLDLVRARTKLATGDFQASEKQMQAMAKAAVIYARVVKVDLRTAMDKLSDSAVLGRDKPLRQLGIDVELLGTKTEKTENFLSVLEERFGGVTVKADNANEKIQQTEAALSDAAGALGHAIIKGELFQRALDAIAGSAKAAAGDIKAATKEAASFATGALHLIGAGGAESTILAAVSARRQLDKYRADYASAVSQGPQQPARTGRLGATTKGGNKGNAGGGYDVSRFQPEYGGGGSLGGVDEEAEELARKLQLIQVTQQLADIRAEDAFQQQVNNGIIADSNAAVGESIRVTNEAIGSNQGLANSLGGLASGFMSAVDAAIVHGQNFGLAMLAMAKQVSYSLAGDLFTRAIHSKIVAATLATNPLTAAAAPLFAAQAVQYAGWGALFAAGGVGLSFAQAGAQGTGVAAGGGGGGSGASLGGGARSSGGGYRPATGGSRRSKEQVYSPTINVYLDAQNPAAGLHWRKLQGRN